MAFKHVLRHCIHFFILSYIVCGNLDDLTTHPGHLKPIGSHGKILEVESIDYFPEPVIFFQKYVQGSKPLVIRDGAKISPAYSLWTDEYFLTFEKGKKELVVVEQAKKENRTLPPEKIPFTEFVQRYSKEDIYLVNELPDFLSKDVFLPPSLLCPDVVKYLLAKLMWFSSGGTKSVLHYDSAENINCLFTGTKKFYLINPNKYSDKVTIENINSAYSNVDIERVDFVKYPGLADVEYHFVEMQHGDCLYIPYFWYHHVSSVGRNLAVNIWWSASARPHLPDCNLANTTLEKFHFRGFNELFPREVTDAMKSTLKTMLDEYEDKVTLEQFRLFVTSRSDLFEHDAEWSDEMMKKLDQIFHYLNAPSPDAELTPDDITALTDQIWDKIFPLVKELNTLVNDQFEQDGEDDDGEELSPQDLIKDEL